MIQKPKGTYDVYGEYGRKILYLEELLKALMEKYISVRLYLNRVNYFIEV